MAELRIADNFSIPLDFATDTTAVLAKKGVRSVVESCVCRHCGVAFEFRRYPSSRATAGRFCSPRCRGRKVKPRACRRCASEFTPKAKDAAMGHGWWCSRACYDADRPAVRSYKKRGARHEHRIVAEEMLGRPLNPGEVVHHEDRDRLNNDPTNLVVIPSQSEHAREHCPPGVRVGSKAWRELNASGNADLRASDALFPGRAR